MAEYIPINPSEIEPEAPLTSSLASRWTNNPIAIAEGAPGAPRIQTNAIANGAVTAAKLASGAGERDWVLARVASAPLGAVGTYASLALLLPGSNQFSVTANEGDTRPGSSLRWSSTYGGDTSITSPSGTWMCMGRASTTRLDGGDVVRRPSLWLRIA